MGRRAKSPKGKADANESSEIRDLEKRLAESLERERATGEILRVISRSPIDVQPVFDAIVRNAVRLCNATYGDVYRFDGAMVHFVAHHNFHPEQLVRWQQRFPRAPGGGIGRVIETRGVVRVSDVHSSDGAVFGPAALELMLAHGTHSALLVPMSRHNAVIGVITLTHRRVGAFTEAHVELLQTFADQAVIAIENVRLFTELEARNRDLTATGEILRVISSSPTDAQPVFETIADNAVRLYRPWSVAVYRFDGELLHVAAARGGLPGSAQSLREQGPRRPTRDVMAGRCILERSVVHVRDFETDADVPAAAREIARLRGFKATITVPMLKDEEPIGVISISRTDSGGFSQTEIDLLETFADQAVIAIENVRLFTELQASNRELTTALDTQTATSDILRVISHSQTDVQPVFDAIVASAVRLLRGYSGGLTRVAADQIELAALTSTDDAGNAALRARFPQSLHSEGEHAQALRDRAPLNIADAPTDPRLLEAGRASARIRGYRSQVVVPMLRHDEAVGTITVSRREPGGFTGDEIALLQTFADQARIAIENVRLFTELQEKNEALTQAHAEVSEALEQQTATSEILRVISRSPTDVQPVFDSIAQSAVRLCGSTYCFVFRVEAEYLHIAAYHGVSHAGLAELRRRYPAPLSAPYNSLRSVRERCVIQLTDADTDPALTEGQRRVAQMEGYRSQMFVPMLQGDRCVGVIGLTRTENEPFPDTQVGLLKTFADQAVIAIENVRLFTELQASNRELTTALDTQTATSDILRVISRSQTDVQPVFDAIVQSAVRLLGAYSGALGRIAGDQIELAAITTTGDAGDAAVMAAFPQALQSMTPHAQAIRDRAPLNTADAQTDPRLPETARAAARARGFRGMVAVPMLRHDEAIGAIAVSRRDPGGFTGDEIALLETFADQAVIAIENARLLTELHARTAELTQSVGEIEDKSRQLEAASRHKSEFLANMSHELRTPLNAIIGFSEVLTERMFGELNDKQDEYLKDIYASGQHLLSLINDILDLSKIEAGRMELEPADFDLPGAIDNALTLVRERAGRRGIMLGRAIDERVGTIHADERKVKQVLLNLLSNALKFTPEGGRVDVRAAVSDGMVEVSVVDTGVGIAPEDQEAVFEEFRQVGTADKKVGGTGLGLALSRKFIELHGGRIGVKSQVGAGSTFTFTIPAPTRSA